MPSFATILRSTAMVFAPAAVVLVFGVGPPAVRAADISTDDGLTLRLDDATGTIQAILVDGQTLPRLEDVPRGLSYQEIKPIERHEPNALAHLDFDEGTEGWIKNAATVRRTDGGADGSPSYVRLGENQRYGQGVRLEQRVPVRPGGVCEISWSARVPSSSATYILYLRLFDETGQDVTEQITAPRGWDYSLWSRTHYQYAIEVEKANAWERLSRDYMVPKGVAYLQVALCLWRGDYVDADSLQIAEVGRGGWLDKKSPTGPLTAEVDGKTCYQRLSLREENLDLTLKYLPGPNHIRVEAEVRDTHDPPRDRVLQVRYTLPIGAEGWQWDDDIRTSRKIEGSNVYQNSFACVGHAVSLYPFSSIHDGRVGVALGVPMDWPRIERRQYSLESGYQTSFDLGISPLTKKIGPGKATFAFVIYKTDANWGFRSAAARYYDIFPSFFVKRAQREGCWLFPVYPSEIPHPEDFGFTFWEGYSNKPDERACARRHGIYIFPYTEPWGLRQPLPSMEGRGDVPTYEEVLATLQAWGDDCSSDAKWADGSRRETAQAVLNSLPKDADGRSPFSISIYNNSTHWWRTNPDPDLPKPNRADVCRKGKIEPRLPNADGVYLDSVTVWLGTYENYRKQHIACADLPLTFGVNGRPCLLGVMSQYDFIAWIADRLHSQGKLVHTNIFPTAYRFYAHLGDVLGSEVGSWGGRRQLDQVESDAICSLRRTYAYQKPTANLLQEGDFRTPRPPLTRQQVEQYLNHQTFYGFYPGISTAGGEDKPGYHGWKRYFRSPEQFERDRDLFQKYIPVIRRINKAGWEPVTYAKTSDDSVMVERFGAWSEGDLHFTLRNRMEEEERCVVVVQLAALGAGREDPARAVVREIVSDSAIAARPDESNGSISFQIELAPAGTAVISVSGEEKQW